MKQQTFSDIEYANRRRKTKREAFLDSMETIIPWKDWVDMIRPFYHAGKRGRRPIDIETMLRMYLMQNWFNLSDVGIEDAIYDSYAMRKFMRLDFLKQQVPDSTTLLHFRHLIEEHHIGEKIFNDVTQRLDAAGLIMHGGTIVDATIISAPSSTKNQTGERDPEMHQTKKGNQWYFGMKAHIGVDAKSGLTHSLETTAANEHDLNQVGNLLHGEEAFVFADAGYQGAENREELADVKAQWAIAMRPGRLKELKKHPRKNKAVIAFERLKSSIRAKVEHPFRIIKRQFGFVKARFKGLRKNDNQLAMLFTLANLFRVDQMIRAWDSCAQKSR